MVLGDGRVVFKDVSLIPNYPGNKNCGPGVTTPLFTPTVPVPPVGSNTSNSQSLSSSVLHILDNHFGGSSASSNIPSANLKNPKMSMADFVKPAWGLPDNVKVIFFNLSEKYFD